MSVFLVLLMLMFGLSLLGPILAAISAWRHTPVEKQMLSEGWTPAGIRECRKLENMRTDRGVSCPTNAVQESDFDKHMKRMRER